MPRGPRAPWHESSPTSSGYSVREDLGRVDGEDDPHPGCEFEIGGGLDARTIGTPAPSSQRRATYTSRSWTSLSQPTRATNATTQARLPTTSRTVVCWR